MIISSDASYGHVIADEKGVMFTSPEAANSALKVMSDVLDKMSIDMSKLIGIPVECIIQDYVEETGNNLMHEAFKAVTGRDEPTLTRELIDRLQQIIHENLQRIDKCKTFTGAFDKWLAESKKTKCKEQESRKCRT